MKTTLSTILVALSMLLFFSTSWAQFSSSRPTFKPGEPTVSTTFFIWYASNGGQLSGPWMPLEGRENWTGTSDWWKTQIKQVMMANIDMILVHLMHQTDERRVTLFQALYELRQEGYEIPKVIPYLDPLITWNQGPKLDMAKEEDKDKFVDQYIRFYNLYFGQNPDPYAEDYLGKMDGQLILDTWHTFVTVDNIDQLTRQDVTERLAAAFPNRPLFQQGVYMITTALNMPLISFADERAAKFEINEYYHEVTYKGITTATLKAGYWDQNIREPGDFLPRDGGDPYREAWKKVSSDIDRVYIESWNEYDEGTGIYAGNVSGPHISDSNNSGNTDVWSDTDDPFEYIRTTAEFGSAFNNIPNQDSRILSHNLPETVEPGKTYNINVLVQNLGDHSWTGNNNFRFALWDAPVSMGDIEVLVDDTDSVNEINIYDGIFRGRPVKFSFALTIPQNVDGDFKVSFSMYSQNSRFGETLDHTFKVEDITGTKDPDFTTIAVYPNPAYNNLHLSANPEFSQGVIYNSCGLKVREFTTKESNDITIADLSAGIYYLTLQPIQNTTGKIYRARFVKL